MKSQKKPKSIRWAFQGRNGAGDHHRSGANDAGPATASSSSRAHVETGGKQGSLKYTALGPESSSNKRDHADVPIEESEGADRDSANELTQTVSSSASTRSALSTAPSTDTGSHRRTNTSSSSPPTSIFQDQESDGQCSTTETPPTSGFISTNDVIEICPGIFVAATEEPRNEDKLQWRALSKRIHMAFAKTCRRYPNLSVQFKLAGASADCLHPMILFVSPPETQKQVRKFLRKQKWLSEAECGYKNMVLDGTFHRVALDGEGGVDGGLFIRAEMGDVKTLCGRLGRLEGALNPDGVGSRFTIGGVIVVNDTLCCLTTGHVLFDRSDASEMEDSDDDEETDEGEDPYSPVNAGQPTSPLGTDPGSDDLKNDPAGVTDSHVSQELRIGRLLTTSTWKRGVFASNEDWSLIRLDAVCNTDEWTLNQFHYPATEVQDSFNITIDHLARSEADMTESEVIILAGCTGPQKGRLNTTMVQLYLDNATFEAREIITQNSLRMGDSGSWVVQGSKLLGHVFAIQEGKPWSYMIPITQVIDDIQNSLLVSSIELPTPGQAKVSLLCQAKTSHASMIASGLNVCPSCKQDLSSPGTSQKEDLAPGSYHTEDEMSPDDNESSGGESLAESFDISEHSSNQSIKASTVPTSYIPSTIPGSSISVPRHSRSVQDESLRYIPFCGETISSSEYSAPEGIWKPRYRGPIPYIALEAELDEVQPRNRALERLIKTDSQVVFDFENPINENVRTTRIVLVTPPLNDALRHVVPWHPSVNQRHRQIAVNEPYAPLVRHLPQLAAYASELRSTQMTDKSKPPDSRVEEHPPSHQPQAHSQLQQVDTLVTFTRYFMEAAKVEDEYARHRRKVCIFNNLWLLLHPGMTVYVKDNNSKEVSAYVISYVVGDPSSLRPAWQTGLPFLVRLWRLSFDGRHVTRQMCSAAIDYFEGERDITSLKVFPCEYLDKADGGETRRKLEGRGRAWYQLLRGGTTSYTGKLPGKSDMDYEGPVVVDQEAVRRGVLKQDSKMLFPVIEETEYLREKTKSMEWLERSECDSLGFPWSSYGPIDPEENEDLELPENQADGSGHRYLLCSPYLPGFLVNRNECVWIDVKYCSPLKKDSQAFDQLLQPSHTKDAIRTLVQDFRQSTSPALRGSQRRKRSENLTILLHGSSGTGKRYTAECLAEAEGMILMTMNPGDIGSDADRAKVLLSGWLEMAQKSNAIAFFPAADPYMGRVPTTAGNGGDVMSVFWECIEAHRGVVILTTSRTVDFDSHILSRISLPIYYAPFDSEARQEIGMQLMRHLEHENGILEISPDAREVWKSTLAEVDWNGHEIKRVFENAVAMARNRTRTDPGESGVHVSEPPILKEDDLLDVVESKRQFEVFVKSLQHDFSPLSRQNEGPRRPWVGDIFSSQRNQAIAEVPAGIERVRYLNWNPR